MEFTRLSSQRKPIILITINASAPCIDFPGSPCIRQIAAAATLPCRGLLVLTFGAGQDLQVHIYVQGSPGGFKPLQIVVVSSGTARVMLSGILRG